MISPWMVTRAAFGAASKLLETQLRGDGDEGDDTTAAPVDRAIFYQQLGVAVRPVVRRTLRALGLEHGDEVAVLKVWDKAFTPTDLDEGETRLYAAGAIATAVRLLAARIDVVADRINLGAGATKKVNREGDTTENGTLAVAAAPAPGPPGSGTVLTLTFTPPGVGAVPQVVAVQLAGAVVGTIVPATPGPLHLSGLTGPGSNKVRAED